ncbi:hypothetical protein DAEQUDRAFT_290234 [Daedalea quercina L-15889]|uniref:Uncharacterized protein n=1 Tax=Daedalea quercina L-15889 TaxID=1314783 RepID=A0A165TY09_9APHY|nr:hypothetical protein DAEQUDRAFT_290234 [Daedalea quercina L-15889]
MLILPYFLKSIAALRAVFVLIASASASRYTHHFGKPTIGGCTRLALGLALAYSLIELDPPDDPTSPQFGHLSESPPTDMIIWRLHSDVAAYHLELDGKLSPAADQDITISELDAPTFISGMASPVHSDITGSLPPSAASAPVVIGVPELDWSIPGAPTVKAPKIEEVKSNAVYYDLYFVDFYLVRANSTFDPDSLLRPSPPAAPDDTPPRMWWYEAPLLRFERLCMKKSEIPLDIGSFKLCCILVMRFLVLGLTMCEILWSLAPIPRLVRRAWRARRRAHRPLSERRLMRYRRR